MYIVTQIYRFIFFQVIDHLFIMKKQKLYFNSIISLSTMKVMRVIIHLHFFPNYFKKFIKNKNLVPRKRNNSKISRCCQNVLINVYANAMSRNYKHEECLP